MASSSAYIAAFNQVVCDGHSAIFTVQSGTPPQVGFWANITNASTTSLNGIMQEVVDRTETTFTVLNSTAVGTYNITGNASYSPNASILYRTVPEFIRTNDQAVKILSTAFQWNAGSATLTLQTGAQMPTGITVGSFVSNGSFNAYTMVKSIASTSIVVSNVATSDGTSPIKFTNTYPLYTWINTFSNLLDTIDGLSRDNIDFTEVASNANLNNMVPPGWSQIMDVNRCPVYALPWLAQLFGVTLVADSTLSSSAQRTAWQTAIKERSAFDRGTLAFILSKLVSYINIANAGTSLDINTSTNTSLPNYPYPELVVFEQTKNPSTHSGPYTQDAYYYNILIPSAKIPTMNYATLLSTTGTYGAWSYSHYSDIPSGLDALQANVTSIQPAGLMLTLGGY